MADQKGRTVDSDIAALPAEGRATAAALRGAILSAEPDARESVKWGQPVFDVNGPFVALKGHARHDDRQATAARELGFSVEAPGRRATGAV